VSHRAAFQPDDQTRVYTVPYIVDTASPFPGMEGLRIHWPIVQASDRNVQMVDDFKNALCLGAEGLGSDGGGGGGDSDGPRYTVTDGRLSHLGVGLEWGGNDGETSMSTHVVRGMPYATMKYNTTSATNPTIYSYNGLSSDVQIDRDTPFEPQTSRKPKLVCGVKGSLKKGTVVPVKSHLHLHIMTSDFTWMVFFSKPVKVSCTTPNGSSDPNLRDFKLSIVEDETEKDSDSDSNYNKDSNLVVRVALLDQCTTGRSSIKQHCLERNAHSDPEGYERLLKDSSHAIPNSPTIDFEYSSTDVAKLNIDWDASSTHKNASAASKDLLMFGLPHHLESLSEPGGGTATNNVTNVCVHSFHGDTCLVQNSKWTLEEPLGAPLSFYAPRPPKAELVPAIAEQLATDIRFKLPDNTLRGASDTYFSGKIIARIARVLVIAKELESLATASSVEDVSENYYGDDSVTTSVLEESIAAASDVDLPSPEEFEEALNQLKQAVTVWLKSNAEAPYIYDESWGGLVNCGCRYVGCDGHGTCENAFPDCPALGDVNEDFGNGA
jgi:hypothetical protein